MKKCNFRLEIVVERNASGKIFNIAWEAQLNNNPPVKSEDALDAIIKTGIAESESQALNFAKEIGINFSK